MSFDFVRFKPVMSEDILRVFWKQLLKILVFFFFLLLNVYVYAHGLALSLTMAREAALCNGQKLTQRGTVVRVLRINGC